MSMKQTFIFIALLSFVALSCKPGKKDMLLGSWSGVKLENPAMDSFFTNSQTYIDTIGNNGNAATNMELYGVTNMDSVRKILQQQHDEAKSKQMAAVTNTVFNFKKDSVVYVSFNGNMDTSKWYMENDALLTMESLSGQDKGIKVRMDIITLTDSELKLKIEQQNTYSTVTFKRSGK